MKIVLSEAQLNRLSEICADISQITLASIVIPFALDKYNLVLLVWGLTIALTFWVLSLSVIGEKNES